MKKYFLIILFFTVIKVFSQLPINGIHTIGANFGLGGNLIQNTQIDIDTFRLQIFDDSTKFIMGKVPILPGYQFPFYGFHYDNGTQGYFGRLDLRSFGAPDMWTAAFFDPIRYTSNGLNVRKEAFTLSVYDTIYGPHAKYEYGFTGYPLNSDHFAFDRTINLDVTLIKAHLNYGRIQHWYDTTVASGMHYNEVFVSDKIYLKTDLDTSIVAEPSAKVSMPGKKTGGAYFINNQILSSNSTLVKGTVTQIGFISTGVTLNTPMGVITTVSSTLAAGASTNFTVNNSFVKANSNIQLIVRSLTNGTPYVYITQQGTGFFTIRIVNLSTTTAFNNILNINFSIN